MTTSGGNRIKRSSSVFPNKLRIDGCPLSSTQNTASITNPIRAASHNQPLPICSTVSSSSSAGLNGSSHSSAMLMLLQGIDSPANRTEPNRIPGGYHQLLTPKVKGSNPAEIAGAIGDPSMKITAIAPTTVNSTDMYP